jgi:hypothetical protein
MTQGIRFSEPQPNTGPFLDKYSEHLKKTAGKFQIGLWNQQEIAEIMLQGFQESDPPLQESCLRIYKTSIRVEGSG